MFFFFWVVFFVLRCKRNTATQWLWKWMNKLGPKEATHIFSPTELGSLKPWCYGLWLWHLSACTFTEVWMEKTKSGGRKFWVACVIRGQECCRINLMLVLIMFMLLPFLSPPFIIWRIHLQLIRFALLLFLPFAILSICFLYGWSCSGFVWLLGKILERSFNLEINIGVYFFTREILNSVWNLLLVCLCTTDQAEWLCKTNLI